MSDFSEFLERIKAEGGDPEYYKEAYALITDKWARPAGKQPWLAEIHARIGRLVEEGFVEVRRIENRRSNGSLAGAYCEFRLPD